MNMKYCRISILAQNCDFIHLSLKKKYTNKGINVDLAKKKEFWAEK